MKLLNCSALLVLLLATLCDPCGAIHAPRGSKRLAQEDDATTTSNKTNRLRKLQTDAPIDVVLLYDEQLDMGPFISGFVRGMRGFFEDLDRRTAGQFRVGLVGFHFGIHFESIPKTPLTSGLSTPQARPHVHHPLTTDVDLFIEEGARTIGESDRLPVDKRDNRDATEVVMYVLEEYLGVPEPREFPLGLFNNPDQASKGICIVLFSESYNVGPISRLLKTTTGTSAETRRKPLRQQRGETTTLVLNKNGGTTTRKLKRAKKNPYQQAVDNFQDFLMYFPGLNVEFVGVNPGGDQILEAIEALADGDEATGFIDLNFLRDGVSDDAVEAVFDQIATSCVQGLGAEQTYRPSDVPSTAPSTTPPEDTTVPSDSPSGVPSVSASGVPSLSPTFTEHPSDTPSAMPSSAPSESIAPSSLPSATPTVFCDDIQEVLFDVVSSMYQKTCAWLQGRAPNLIKNEVEFQVEYVDGTFTAEQLQAFAGFPINSLDDFGDLTWADLLCAEEGGTARALCEETCGTCTDECYDDEREEWIDQAGNPHFCSWLRAQPRNWEDACANTDAACICRETCETCFDDLSLNPFCVV